MNQTMYLLDATVGFASLLLVSAIRKPDIVFFLTDDEDRELFRAIQGARHKELTLRGTTLNGFVSTPLCCPSRLLCSIVLSSCLLDRFCSAGDFLILANVSGLLHSRQSSYMAIQ